MVSALLLVLIIVVYMDSRRRKSIEVIQLEAAVQAAYIKSIEIQKELEQSRNEISELKQAVNQSTERNEQILQQDKKILVLFDSSLIAVKRARIYTQAFKLAMTQALLADQLTEDQINEAISKAEALAKKESEGENPDEIFTRLQTENQSLDVRDIHISRYQAPSS